MNDLTAAIFVADTSATTLSQNLKIEYVSRLINVAGLSKASKYDNLAKATALFQLQSILDKSTAWGADQATKAHKAYIDRMITKALEA
ncbi:hypothetical protein PSMA106859_18390 [Pseudoalteromonas maricaloris]